MKTLTKALEAELRKRTPCKIEVKYIPSEMRARYGYTSSGIREAGFPRLWRKWRVAPIRGLQFDPFEFEED